MLTLPRNIALIANPLLPKALSVADAILRKLKEKNIEHSLFTTRWTDNWIDFTEAWVIGGDGTLNHFINHYPQFDLPIAIFKGGTGNDFHGLLYGNVSIEQQVEFVLSATPKPVDAGLCNNRLFINRAGIGFEGELIKELADSKKTSYLFTALRNILRYKPFLCTVNTEDFHWGKKCFTISVENARQYGSSARAVPKSLFNDGLLETHIVGNIYPLFRLRYLPFIKKGEHSNLPLITYVKSSMVIVKALQQIPAHVDGEAFTATEFNIECLQGRFLLLY